MRENNPFPRFWLQAVPFWLTRKPMPRLSPSLRTSEQEGVRPLGAPQPQSPDRGMQSLTAWLPQSPSEQPLDPVCTAQPVVANAKITSAEKSMDFIVSNPFEIWVCSSSVMRTRTGLNGLLPNSQRFDLRANQ